MLRGYPHKPTVRLGDTLRVHVATDDVPISCRAYFYRQGATLAYVGSSAAFTAFPGSPGSCEEAWGWPSVDIPIPLRWRQGVYVVLLAKSRGVNPRALSPQQLYASPSALMCVLQSRNPGARSCILYKLALFTYQAYNDLGSPGGSLYTGTGRKVSMHRPGGGVGGHAWDSSLADLYDDSSPRQVFAHWDVPFIEWLEASGYTVEFCTDLDVHTDGATLLGSYKLLLCVGHDEYWSAALRTNVDDFIGRGGNVAFFSGNTCWWRVHVQDGDTTLFCDKPTVDHWQQVLPENSTTGVSYNNAGGRWGGPRDQIGYTIQYSNHWVYQGTGLADGAVLGAQDHLVGYECDGAPVSPVPGPIGYAVPSLTNATPPNFMILGLARLTGPWDDWLQGPASAATMGIYQRRGIVFNAATTDWARVLRGGNVEVGRITRNVIDRLHSRSVNILGVSTSVCGPLAVEGGTVTFTADTSGLPSMSGLTFQWSSTLGGSAVKNQPTYEVTFSSPPAPVTIFVTIQDGSPCPVFGTLTITPLTRADATRLQLICELRRFVIGSAVYRKPVRGVRDRVPIFVDPLWDPIRGELTQSLFEGAAELRSLIAANKRIGTKLQELLKTQERAAKVTRGAHKRRSNRRRK